MPKDNKKNRPYTKEFKESVLKRLEPPTNDTITSLSKELRVPRTTIYQWTKKNNKDSMNHKPTSKWTSEDKFQVVLESTTLSEEELAEYCRRKGIYVADIKTWKEQCLKANQNALEDPQSLKISLKEEKTEIKS